MIKFLKILTITGFVYYGLLGLIASADEEGEVVIDVNIPPGVKITRLNSSVTSATVNPATGIHSGLHIDYKLVTNGTDTDFDFVISSSITVKNGETVSAYSDDGNLLFAHVDNPPTSTDVDNAKKGSGLNKNVIAYPTSIDTDFSSSFQDYDNKKSYVITLGDLNEGSIIHRIEGTPFSKTYKIGNDQSGTYRALVTFSVIPK